MLSQLDIDTIAEKLRTKLVEELRYAADWGEYKERVGRMNGADELEFALIEALKRRRDGND